MAPVSVSTYVPPPTTTSTVITPHSLRDNRVISYLPTPTPTSISPAAKDSAVAETDLDPDRYTRISPDPIPTISVTESSANVIDPYHPWPTQDASARGYPTTTPSISRWTPPSARPTQPVTEPSEKESEGSGLWPYVKVVSGVVGGCVALGVTVAVTKRGVRRWDADGRPQITWKPREWPSITRPGSRYISGHSYSGPPEGDGDGTEEHELPPVPAPVYCAVSTHDRGCNEFRSEE